MYWILDGTEIRAATISEWIERLPAQIARDQRDGVVVSTVFVGLDTGLGEPPFLFETMVFNGPSDGMRRIYRTWAEAAAGHAAMVKELFG